jgi:hypothetical protein
MDLFAEFMKLVVRLCVGIGWLIGAGIQKITLSAIEGGTRGMFGIRAEKYHKPYMA